MPLRLTVSRAAAGADTPHMPAPGAQLSGTAQPTAKRRTPRAVWARLVLVLLALGVPSIAVGPLGLAGAAALRQSSRGTPLSYGFQGDFFHVESRPRAIAAIQDAGFEWAKQQVRWEDYEIRAAECVSQAANCVEESVGGRLKYFRRDRLNFLDALVSDVSRSGLRLLLSVVRAPSFYTAPGGHTPADPSNLHDFLFFLASRYRGRVHAIEPWNEQNLSWEWGSGRLWPNAPSTPPQGVVEFAGLQKAAYQGIKAADPTITVVLPALTPTGLGECWQDSTIRQQSFCAEQVQTAIDDRLYLDFLYQVNGGEIKGYYDVLGVHPSGYNNPPDDWMDASTVSSSSFKGHGSFYVRRYQQLRAVQLRHGDTKPMWFTEVGWSVSARPAPGYEYAGDNTEEQRGAYIARLLEQVHGEAPYVTNVFLWNLNFRTLVPEADEKHGFGLLNADWSRTPGYLCAADFVRSGSRISRAECRLPSAGSVTSGDTQGAGQAPTATPAPTASPPASPTPVPVPSATAVPTFAPTAVPTAVPTLVPTAAPTLVPTIPPTIAPTAAATFAPPPIVTVETLTAAASPPTLSPTPAPSATVVAAPSLRAALDYRVEKGDTLYSIARRYGTTVDTLVAVNGLVSRDAVLPVGRVLTVPPDGVAARGGHVVVKGDTLFSIARRHGTTVSALASANGLPSPEGVLSVGRTLVIP